MTYTMAMELARYGIRANAVAPGPIETDMLERFSEDVPRDMMESMLPMGRVGTADEIANPVVWLSSEQSQYVTGQTIGVDGGGVLRA